jgi:hypothetical protein
MEEDDDWRGRGVGGPTNIQRVPRALGIGDGARELNSTPHANPKYEVYSD